MADRKTLIRGNQIKDATVTENELASSVAGDGISGGAGTALAVDLNELTAAVVDVSADSIAIVDATDNSSKKEAIADIVTAIAGDGLASAAGVLALDLNELTAAVVDVTADSIAIIDATDDSSKKESIDDVVTALAGDGIQNVASQIAVDVSDFAGDGLKDDGSENLALDLNELTAAVVDVSADSIAIVDATDDGSKKESIADLVTAIAGSGLTATNGVLSADAVADNIVEGDLVKEDFSALLDGVETDFDLSFVANANSLAVYLNGAYLLEGAANDYELNPDSGDTKTIRLNGDVALAGEVLQVQYIKDN